MDGNRPKERNLMPRANQSAGLEKDTDALAQLAQWLQLKVAPEDLAALCKQLRVIDELEGAALQDYPPILRMDADWHD